MESSNNSNGQETNDCPPADRGAGNVGWGGGGGGGGAMTALVDEEIVTEVIIGIIGMTTTTRKVSSLVESRQRMDTCLTTLGNIRQKNTFKP